MLILFSLLLFAAGVLLLFSQPLEQKAAGWYQNRRELLAAAQTAVQKRIRRRQNLKTIVRRINEGVKPNFIQSAYHSMQQTLIRTGSGDKIRQMRLAALCSGGCGAAIAVYLNSPLLLPILSVGMGLLPLWLTRFLAFQYSVRMQNELSVVLAMVTNSYIRTEKIVRSVEENLEYMNEPVKEIFSAFVYNSNFISADITANLRELKEKIDSHIFQLWWDNLILCQRDINHKYSLGAVVEQFTMEKELYNLLDAEVSKPILTLAFIVLGTASAFPLLALFGSSLEVENIFATLFSTLPGQCIITGYAFSILYAINTAIRVSTSIDD